MNFIRKHKYITLFIVLLLIASGIILLLSQRQTEGDSISKNMSTNNTARSNSNNRSSTNSTSPQNVNKNTTETPSDTQVITAFIETDPLLLTSLSVKNTHLEKEVKDYRLVTVDMYNSKTKISHTDIVIIKNGEVITGINSALSASQLQEKWVPDDIVNSYEEMMRDI